MKSEEKIDSSTQLKILKSQMSITCIIDETRLIYNIPTILRIYKIIELTLNEYVFETLHFKTFELNRKM